MTRQPALAYDVAVAAYAIAGRAGPFATQRVHGAPGARPLQATAVRVRKTASAAVASARPVERLLAGAGCPKTPRTVTNPPQIPVFCVTVSTPDIAANDAAAISGTDPVSGTKAQTFDSKGAPMKFKALGPIPLHYAPYSTGRNVSTAHRRKVCGGGPFKVDGTPGPSDRKVDAKGKVIFSGVKTSCDEFPFASTEEGGGNVPTIIRGVELAENLSQGGQLSSFLQSYALVLGNKKVKGLFRVCVEIAGQSIGDCNPPYYK